MKKPGQKDSQSKYIENQKSIDTKEAINFKEKRNSFIESAKK